MAGELTPFKDEDILGVEELGDGSYRIAVKDGDGSRVVLAPHDFNNLHYQQGFSFLNRR